MKSHAILRTNVGLTTNVKLVVGTTYSLYLDSIESNIELSDQRYKKFQFNKDNYWDELVPYFFKNTPINIAYHIKYDNDNDNMSTSFSNQYDDLYQFGAKNIIDNKDYSEEYEYFAPLYIHKGSLPSNFIIFRIDGPGLIDLNSSNFKTEILNKLKCVKVFDLTRKTPLGEWLDKNITNNTLYPLYPFYMDFRRMEFSSWIGMDYEDGGYSEKSFMLDSMLEYENTFFDFQKMVLDGYKNNKVVFPNIINFSFLFDDTPATPTSIRKWSLNRYLGFYIDKMEYVISVTPCSLSSVKSNVTIDKWNILSSSTGSPFENVSNNYKIEIDGNFYSVVKYVETGSTTITKIKTGNNLYADLNTNSISTKWKILSNISLLGLEDKINKNVIKIDSQMRIVNLDDSPWTIDGFELADVWLIKIGDLYHNIQSISGYLVLNTDYAFYQTSDKFEYWINDPDPLYKKSISLDLENPLELEIFKLSFTSIKDFDTSIVDTNFSKFEYMKNDKLSSTDEPKMYVTDLESTSNPKEFDQFKINGTVVNIPTSSEYTSNNETFRIEDNRLTDLWRKNPIHLKWGLQGSISSNDYPYLLNNSFNAEDYNRTTNTSLVLPNRQERNLDYFLSINSSTASYDYHSLHIENKIGNNIDTNFTFELDKYLGLSYSNDYFSYFFGKKSNFNNYVFNTEKYSYFNTGDNIIPNMTLFRGIKFNLYNVDGVKITDGKVETLNVKSNNSWDGYKFAILLSKNEWSLKSNPNDINIADIIKSENTLKWEIIDTWKWDSEYQQNQRVLYNDILWVANTYSIISNPISNPSNSSSWDMFTQSSIFWSPLINGSDSTVNNNMWNQGFGNIPPLVWNSGEFYYSSGISGNNFWIEGNVYNAGDIVINNNQTWSSDVNLNSYRPGISNWTKIDVNTIWTLVELWKPDFTYTVLNSNWNGAYFDSGHYVIWEGVVWGTTQSPSLGVIPPLDSNWTRIYSLESDTEFVYNNSIKDNNIIHVNNRFYCCIDNTIGIDPNVTYNQTLENGINIYINKKWKNVLINIYINDSTYDLISNVDRDLLYNDIYSKLSANNFINSINDPSSKYGFSDSIKYVIIDNDIKIYDFNILNSITKLPVVLRCEYPDTVWSRIKSLDIRAITLSISQLKPKRKLEYGNINTLDQLNWYSDLHIGNSINRFTSDASLIPYWSGLRNNIYNIIYRHSGPYSPIFNTIQLFEAPGLTGGGNNFKFDTELSDFGIIRERVMSKVNKRSNILKLRNFGDLKSIYPQVDEFGYTVNTFFIFKSTWDLKYHIECSEVTQVLINQPTTSLSTSNNININL